MGQSRQLRLITFKVGPETFVLDIMSVAQIVPYSGSTSLPTAPGFIEGIVIIRNEVVPVIDLRNRLYPDLGAAVEQPLVLVTHSSVGTIALKVDEVRRIVNVSSDALLPPPPIVRGVRGELLLAVIPHADEVLLLIDVEAILSADEKHELAKTDFATEPNALPRAD